MGRRWQVQAAAGLSIASQAPGSNQPGGYGARHNGRQLFRCNLARLWCGAAAMGGLLRRVRLLLLPAPLWARGGRKHGPDHERAQRPYPGLGAPYPHLGARPGRPCASI